MDFFVLLLCIVVALVVSLIALGIFLVRLKDWKINARRNVFSLASALLIFPVLAPAGTLFAVPLPNAALMILVIYFDGVRGVLSLGDWYLRTWIFTTSSFVLTFSAFRIISMMVLYKQTDRKRR